MDHPKIMLNLNSFHGPIQKKMIQKEKATTGKPK